MSDARYLQIFSMTDHAKALSERFQGDYQGMNATICTSQMEGGSLTISTNTRTQAGEVDREAIASATVILTYRHTDTGELRGTSEAIIPIQTLPWTELPGLEVIELLPKEGLRLKLWNQLIDLALDKVIRIHFAKTIVYLRNYGIADSVTWTETVLDHGARSLHAEVVDRDLTIAAGSGSSITVKMGQETTN